MRKGMASFVCLLGEGVLVDNCSFLGGRGPEFCS